MLPTASWLPTGPRQKNYTEERRKPRPHLCIYGSSWAEAQTPVSHSSEGLALLII